MDEGLRIRIRRRRWCLINAVAHVVGVDSSRNQAPERVDVVNAISLERVATDLCTR